MSAATPVTRPPPAAAADPPADLSVLLTPQGQWSEAEYLGLNPGRLVEFSDGTIEELPMPTWLHQAVVLLFVIRLRAFIGGGGDLTGLVLFAPFSVRLWSQKMRQPDVLYMAGRHADKRHETHWDGADLVVEIVGDDDRRRDLVTKRDEYARAGIAEYWIVDPMLRTVTVLTSAEAEYVEAGVYAAGDTATSVLLAGFAVAVDDVFNAR